MVNLDKEEYKGWFEMDGFVYKNTCKFGYDCIVKILVLLEKIDLLIFFVIITT